MLGDPSIFNNEEMEESPLGSLSNYRCKIMVRLARNDMRGSIVIALFQDASVNYFGTLYKWNSLLEGCLAQELPEYVPGHEYLSSDSVRRYKVNHLVKEIM